MKFMVFSLPRSRSKWLSEFLTYGDSICGHDLAAYARSIEDFRRLLSGVDGSCETGAVVGWKLLRLEFPQARFVVVKRPLGEIIDSIRAKGFEPLIEVLEQRAEMLDVLSQAPEVRTYEFKDLESPGTCREIFEFCLEQPFDVARWQHLASQNIQIDFAARVGWLATHQYETSQLLEEVMKANLNLKGTESCLRLN